MQCKFDILSRDNDGWYSIECHGKICVHVGGGCAKKFKLDFHQTTLSPIDDEKMWGREEILKVLGW